MRIIIYMFIVFFISACDNNLKKEYYDNGNLKSQIHYNSLGEMDGVVKHYYKNGKVSKEIFYTNGKKNGKYTEFYKSGEVKYKTFFKNDEQDGYFYEYYEDGNIMKKAFYKKNIIDSFYLSYYKNKKINMYAIVSDGITNYSITYDISGKITEEYRPILINNKDIDSISVNKGEITIDLSGPKKGLKKIRYKVLLNNIDSFNSLSYVTYDGAFEFQLNDLDRRYGCVYISYIYEDSMSLFEIFKVLKVINPANSGSSLNCEQISKSDYHGNPNF
jgi:hypothetical protein